MFNKHCSWIIWLYQIMANYLLNFSEQIRIESDLNNISPLHHFKSISMNSFKFISSIFLLSFDDRFNEMIKTIENSLNHVHIIRIINIFIEWCSTNRKPAFYESWHNPFSKAQIFNGNHTPFQQVHIIQENY